MKTPVLVAACLLLARAAAAASPSPPASPGPSASPASPAPSPTPLPPLPSAKVAAIEAAIQAFMERYEVPGLSAAVVVGRELRWSAAFGVADVENGVPVRTGSMFRLASVSKPITATAVMQLVEKGKVDLNAPLQAVLPDFPAKPGTLTVRHLLSHQSGIRNWTPDEFRNARRFTSVDEAVHVFADDPLAFVPGSKTLYSSFGYTVLGSVIERASGVPYAEYLRVNVFEPAGLENARVDEVEALVPNRVHGYVRTSDGVLRNSALSDVSNRAPGGGLCATAEDVARFASAVLKGTLLKPASVEAMFRMQRTRDGQLTGYGLGWLLRTTNNRREVYHHGGQPRVSTILLLLPDQGVAVVLLCNLENVSDPLTLAAREIAAIAAR
jgi:serine beta-lactamase-like protein LACTB, mitochondrial